jgi:hypothetical protein
MVQVPLLPGLDQLAAAGARHAPGRHDWREHPPAGLMHRAVPASASPTNRHDHDLFVAIADDGEVAAARISLSDP